MPSIGSGQCCILGSGGGSVVREVWLVSKGGRGEGRGGEARRGGKEEGRGGARCTRGEERRGVQEEVGRERGETRKKEPVFFLPSPREKASSDEHILRNCVAGWLRFLSSSTTYLGVSSSAYKAKVSPKAPKGARAEARLNRQLKRISLFPSSKTVSSKNTFARPANACSMAVKRLCQRHASVPSVLTVF